jgi:proteic killer suppression protein
MILSFRDKRSELFARGEFVRAFQGFDRQGWKRLEILNAAVTLADLSGLPSNRLEALRGDRAGQYSIRINQQWRICFEWPESGNGPSNVEIVDYHEVTPTELSRQISVPPNRISQIIQGKRAITGDTALRLGHWFQTSAQFWLNLQSAYDLRIANDEIGREVAALPTKSTRRRSGA